MTRSWVSMPNIRRVDYGSSDSEGSGGLRQSALRLTDGCVRPDAATSADLGKGALTYAAMYWIGLPNNANWMELDGQLDVHMR
jgi:hypothetical protein